MSDWAKLRTGENHWTGLIVNPADPKEPPPGIHIKLYHDGSSFIEFPWRWSIEQTNPNERFDTCHASGIANTKLGAKLAARRAWRQHLKKQRRGVRSPEFIPLRPPSDG